MEPEIKELVSLLKQSGRTVAFTGAGVSTLSGIRDFRGKNGVYRELWHGLKVEEILSLDCFMEHPEYFYEWAKEFVYRVEDFHPSAVHRVLARMERAGMLTGGLYTQNIDCLHTAAGSRNVFEVHGSPSVHHCLDCRKTYSYQEISPIVLAGKVPHCTACGGIVKPDIVFYGESLDTDMLENGIREFGSADVALALGSSLTVYPAAMLPEQAARSAKTKLVIVNEQPTHLDGEAFLRFTELEAVFTVLEESLFGEKKS